MRLLYVSLGSTVSPSIFGLMFMGRVMLSICSSSCVLYSAGSVVKRACTVLVHFIIILLPFRSVTGWSVCRSKR